MKHVDKITDLQASILQLLSEPGWVLHQGVLDCALIQLGRGFQRQVGTLTFRSLVMKGWIRQTSDPKNYTLTDLGKQALQESHAEKLARMPRDQVVELVRARRARRFGALGFDRVADEIRKALE